MFNKTTAQEMHWVLNEISIRKTFKNEFKKCDTKSILSYNKSEELCKIYFNLE